MSPLDGVRTTAIISPKIWLPSVPLLSALVLYNTSPMLILIDVIAIPQIKLALSKDYAAAMPAGYYDTPMNLRANYTFYYFALTGYQAVMSYILHRMLGAYRRVDHRGLQLTSLERVEFAGIQFITASC